MRHSSPNSKKVVNKDDVIKGLRELGIKDGDNIFVASSLSRFGYVDGGAKAICDALRECAGGGTIVMPSFNFSIFKESNIVLDTEYTESEMGEISEYFRVGKNRTKNLFHPLSYEGDVDLSNCDTYDTWGDKSPYAYMVEHGFKMVMLGTNFYSCPFFHFAEQKNNVPYREPIEYEGWVDGVKTKCRRLRRKYGDSNNNKVYGKTPIKETTIGTAICRSFIISDMVQFLDNAISTDPDYLLVEKGLLSPMPTMKSFDMMEGIKELYKHPRHLVSLGFQNALFVLSEFIPLRYHTWKTGEKVWTWTIPKQVPENIDGQLFVGEYTVKGFGNETIIIPIHLDHPYQANDNLSGVAVAVGLIDMLQRTPDLKYSYKFLFVPETIGTIAYLSRYGTNYKYGVVVDSVGTNGEIVITKTKTPSQLNNYLIYQYRVIEFLSKEHLDTGNDERVLESVNIPSIQISRSPFREYHTEEDTPDIINEDKLKEVLHATYNIIDKIEKDFVPIPTYIGVPCLSAVGLFKPDVKLEMIWHLLDSKRTISEIGKEICEPFEYVYDFVIKMEKKGLIKR